jgi:hypothetical protein
MDARDILINKILDQRDKQVELLLPPIVRAKYPTAAMWWCEPLQSYVAVVFTVSPTAQFTRTSGTTMLPIAFGFSKPQMYPTVGSLVEVLGKVVPVHRHDAKKLQHMKFLGVYPDTPSSAEEMAASWQYAVKGEDYASEGEKWLKSLLRN